MQVFKNHITVFFTFILVVSLLAHWAADAPLVYASSQKSDPQQSSTPACLNRVNIPESELHWIYVPQSADELYSTYNLQWLAGQLIASKAIDASSCPAGGLTLNGYANACGMSLAKTQVVEIQNSFNQAILDAWVNDGVPPVLLKQLIRYESQFWPAQNGQYHYGFGHVTPIGAENALLWNTDLYSVACTSGDTSCGVSFVAAQTLLNSMLNTCPTCPNGIDQAAATRSIDTLAKVVMGYCNQTAQLVYDATGWRSVNVVDYPTLWKLTLVNYNSGSQCVLDAVGASFDQTKGPVDWAHIEANATSTLCSRGVYYANLVTSKAYDFPSITQ